MALMVTLLLKVPKDVFEAARVGKASENPVAIE